MKNILIVDDEKFVRMGLTALIERSGLCTGEIVTCKNGSEALEALKEKTFDVIFSDIKMPIMSGLEFITHLKEQGLSSAKIVIISGYDNFNYAVESMRNGACEYLLKPVDREAFAQLLQKLQAMLDAEMLEGIAVARALPETETKEQKINRAIQFIKENYNKNINMAVVSNEVSMNYTFFSESFKEICGESFVDYLKHVRIGIAKQLLRTNNMQVSKVSAQVGFRDEKHFLRTFKAELGCTPSEYRKQYATQESVAVEE